MTQLKRLYALLVLFQQQFQLYKNPDVDIIEIDVGKSHVHFKFDKDGKYRGCNIG